MPICVCAARGSTSTPDGCSGSDESSAFTTSSNSHRFRPRAPEECPMAVDLKPVPLEAAPAGVALRNYALAGLAELAQANVPTSSPRPEQRYLFDQLAAVAPTARGFLATLPAYLFAPDERDARLGRLASAFGLTVFEQLAVALASAVEDDAMAGRAVAWLQAPVGGSRPTLGLVAGALAAAPGAGPQALHALVSGAAMHSGLLSVMGESGPLPERPFGVPIPICLALAGRDATLPGMTIGLGELRPVKLPPSAHAEAERHARGLAAGGARGLIVRAGVQKGALSRSSSLPHSACARC